MISPDSPSRKGHRSHRDIPFHRIASFEPQPHLMEQWPFCDPCRQRSTPSRLFLMSAIFLFMTVGSVPLYLLLIKTPYGFQEASIISYTLVVVFFTFATTGSGPSGGNVPGYKFTCPAVEPQVPRLLWRHLIFLVALFVLQTALLTVHPQLPDWWNARDRKGMTASMRLYFSLASVWLGHRFLQTSPFSTARTGSFLTGPGAPCLHRDVGSPGAPSSRSDEVG